MRLIIHQAIKDARSLRWLVLVWVLLVAAFQVVTVRAALVPILRPAPPQPDQVDLLIYGYAVVQAILVGLFTVIAVLVVQNDPATGTTAFWFTRPVSVRVLLGGKFTLAAIVLLVVPALADMLAMVAGGLTLGDGVRTLPSTLVTQVAWLVPLFALAAISTNLGQFVLAAFGDVLLFVVSVWALRPAKLRNYTASAEPPTMRDLMTVAAVVLVSLAFIALVAAYRGRRLRNAAAVAGVTPIVVTVLLFAWPWSLASWRHDLIPSPVTAIPLPGSLRANPWDNRGTWSISGGFSLAHVPERQVFTPTAARVWIEYASERVDLRISSAWFPDSQSAADARRLRPVVQALGGARLSDPRPVPVPLPGFSGFLPAGAYDRHAYESGVLHADLRLIVQEARADGAAVARPGERYQASGCGGTITNVTETPDGFAIEVAETRVRSLFEPAPLTMYAARNRRLGVASMPDRQHGSIVLQPDAAPIPVPAHLSGSRVTFEFPAPEGVAPSDWLRGAELVVVQSHPLGHVVVHAVMPHLVLASLRDVTRPMPPPSK